jgi:hypothetical protein
MAILIVGGNRIDGLEKALAARGLGPLLHWTGLKRGELHKSMPPKVELVIVIWHQISHALLRNVRDEANRRAIPMLYSRNTGAPKSGDQDDVVHLASEWLQHKGGDAMHQLARTG